MIGMPKDYFRQGFLDELSKAAVDVDKLVYEVHYGHRPMAHAIVEGAKGFGGGLLEGGILGHAIHSGKPLRGAAIIGGIEALKGIAGAFIERSAEKGRERFLAAKGRRR